MPSRPAKPKPRAATAPADDVAAFLAALEHPHKPLVLAIRRLVLAADPAIGESIKWNAPSFHTTEHFATFHLRAKDGVQLVLHLGAKPRPGANAKRDVPDPDGLLDWKGADRAVVTARDAKELTARKAALTRILRAWITHV